MKKWFTIIGILLSTGLVNAQLPYASGAPNQALLNEPVDISEDFRNFSNTYFIADSLTTFDPQTAQGKIKWMRNVYQTRQAFNNMLAFLNPVNGNEFPQIEYDVNPVLPFSLEFISPKTVRIRMKTGTETQPDQPSLMLVNGFAPKGNMWVYSKIEGGHKYTSPYGSVVIQTQPWHIELYDATEGFSPKLSIAATTTKHIPCGSIFVRPPFVRLFAKRGCSVYPFSE